MPNPDAKNIPGELANTPPKFKRGSPATSPPVTEKTAAWPGLPGKTQPKNRSAGVPRLKTHPKTEGL